MTTKYLRNIGQRVTLLVTAATIVGLSAFAAIAGDTPVFTQAGSGITGSVHDMNAYAAAIGGGIQPDKQKRVCAFCHTPHHSVTDASISYNPGWSRKVSTQAYKAYQSDTFDFAAMGGSDPLIGPSRLCMSCHDGSMAIDSHEGVLPQTGSAVLTGTDVLDTPDHPVGFSYAAALTANPGTLNPQSTPWQGGNGSTIGKRLFKGDFVTCATCHDVHNGPAVVANGAGTDGVVVNYLTPSPEYGSQLCLSCHKM